MWTPDGRKLVFSSQRAGAMNLFMQSADGVGATERLTDSSNAQAATSVSPDGRSLIFTETSPSTGDDVMQMTLDASHVITPLVRSSFVERNGIVSPDGRWLAYEANDSGQFEIFVRPFPEVNSGRWQVSTAGGRRPLWAPSGRELIYVDPTEALMRVGVTGGTAWAMTTPSFLVKPGYHVLPANPGRTYDIAPDGARLLMVKDSPTDKTPAPASIIVVQHWLEELKRLVPTK